MREAFSRGSGYEKILISIKYVGSDMAYETIIGPLSETSPTISTRRSQSPFQNLRVSHLPALTLLLNPQFTI
jgi:hypothetical protein